MHAIREGDPARVKLMGHREIVRGHVGSLARGINVPNAQANAEGVASVNPHLHVGGASRDAEAIRRALNRHHLGIRMPGERQRRTLAPVRGAPRTSKLCECVA